MRPLSPAFVALAAFLYGTPAWASPPKLSIFHFDVNTGDATLILSPDGHGVLVDAGDRGRGANPIVEFLNRARTDGILTSLDYAIATHYDADHIGGLDEVFGGGWYPAIAALDRGNSLLPPLDEQYVQDSCHLDSADVAALVSWGTAPSASCPSSRRASCQIIQYFVAAEGGGRRREIQPGEVLALDHGLEIEAVVVNAQDGNTNSVDVHFTGRRDDCASNNLAVGLLLRFGDFLYLVAGDLTGEPSEDLADVEALIKDEASNLDVYHVNHHGSKTSSSSDFMEAIKPTVAIVSNGRMHNHPHRDVIEGRILAVNPQPAIYVTNRNDSDSAWSDDPDAIADDDFVDYDGMIELAVWRRSYRVFRWRNGNRMDSGDRYFIKERN